MHKTNFQGGNFPIDGPVMQNRTLGWEPTSEKMTPCDGTIKGDTIMYLFVEGVKMLNMLWQESSKLEDYRRVTIIVNFDIAYATT